MSVPPLVNFPQSARVMYIAGIVILVGVGLYFLFMAVDGMALPRHQTSAVVVGKTHREAGQTYTTQVINNRSYTVPHATPEMFILRLDLLGRPAQYVSDRSLYDALGAGDSLRVTYQRRRLTGTIQVVDASR